MSECDIFCKNNFPSDLRIGKSTRQHGKTFIELTVIVCIVLVCILLFLHRMRFYQEQAEQTAMQEVVNALNSALLLQYGQIITRGHADDVITLARDNPMNWLQKRPRNYLGEFFDPVAASAVEGNWLFDLKSRELVYLIDHHNYFKPGSDDQQWVRFHLVPHYETARTSSSNAGKKKLTGVAFEPVQPYSWF
ncbi:MAG: hypothetical protein WCD45_03940 [Gallionella sp.]